LPWSLDLVAKIVDEAVVEVIKGVDNFFQEHTPYLWREGVADLFRNLRPTRTIELIAPRKRLHASHLSRRKVSLARWVIVVPTIRANTFCQRCASVVWGLRVVEPVGFIQVPGRIRRNIRYGVVYAAAIVFAVS